MDRFCKNRFKTSEDETGKAMPTTQFKCLARMNFCTAITLTIKTMDMLENTLVSLSSWQLPLTICSYKKLLI
jgi:hypothetical protein